MNTSKTKLQKNEELMQMINKNNLQLEELWLKKSLLSENALKILVDELYDVSTDAFGQTWLPYSAIDSRVRDSDYLIMLKNSDSKIVAYGANDLLLLAGRSVNYYAAALIRREYQNKGLYSILNNMRLDALDSDAILTRTQNPQVYSGMEKICEENGYKLHPNTVALPKIVVDIAKAHTPKVTDDLVVKGCYWSRELSEGTPNPKTEHEKNIWQRVDVKSGDALILVGLLEKK